jgi:hypothetical protein
MLNICATQLPANIHQYELNWRRRFRDMKGYTNILRGCRLQTRGGPPSWVLDEGLTTSRCIKENATQVFECLRIIWVIKYSSLTTEGFRYPLDIGVEGRITLRLMVKQWNFLVWKRLIWGRNPVINIRRAIFWRIEAMPVSPLPHTSSWRDAHSIKHKADFTFTVLTWELLGYGT